jgi:hypothetical protein
MKRLLPFVMLLAVLACDLAFSRSVQGAQGGEPPPDDERLAKVERELAKSQKELAEMRSQVERCTTYLAAQAELAKSVLASLDESEQAGFTAGINFRSREILLAGFRSFYDGLQKDVPQPTKPAPATEPTPPKSTGRTGGGSQSGH